MYVVSLLCIDMPRGIYFGKCDCQGVGGQKDAFPGKNGYCVQYEEKKWKENS